MAAEVAQRYAQGLLDLAEENGSVESKKDDAVQLLAVLRDNPEVELFFRSVKITKAEKHSFCDAVIGRMADHEMVSFFKLLVDKGRIFFVRQILEEYVHLAEEKLGIRHALIESARELDEASMARIRKTLEEKYHKKFILDTRIDPALIAGFRVITENNVTDATMAGKIADLRNALRKGGQA